MEKVEWNSKTIGRIWGIINEMLYSMALYHEIKPTERDNKCFDPYLREFWISISNNAVMTTITNWCKIFGAKRNNATHYSNFVNSDHFINKLTEIPFEEISNVMKNVRDKFAVHEDDIEKRKEIPYFNNLRKILEKFRETVQEEYDAPEIPPIHISYDAYCLRIQDILKGCRIDWEIIDDEDD